MEAGDEQEVETFRVRGNHFKAFTRVGERQSTVLLIVEVFAMRRF